MQHYTAQPIAPNVEEYACEHCAFSTISLFEMALHLEYVHKIAAEPEPAEEPAAKPKRAKAVSNVIQL